MTAVEVVRITSMKINYLRLSRRKEQNAFHHLKMSCMRPDLQRKKSRAALYSNEETCMSEKVR